MPKFEDKEDFGQEIGRGVITLITRKKGKMYNTSSACDFKSLNTEGAVLELKKIIKSLQQDLRK